MRGKVIAFLLAVGANTPVTNSALAGEPIRIVKGYPVVQATINGRGPLLLLLDTGAARCAVNIRLAEQLGLVSNQRLLLTTMTNEKMVGVANITIRVGSFEEVTAETLIYDLSA